MLMKDKKKDSIALIIAKKMGKPEETSEAPKSEDGAELDSSMGYDAAGEEILKAVESKDVSSLIHSIKNVIQMCLDEQSSEPEEYKDEKPE